MTVRRLAVLALVYLGVMAGCSSQPGETEIYGRLSPLAAKPQLTERFQALLEAEAPQVVVNLPARDLDSIRFVKDVTSADGVDTWVTGNNRAIYMQRGVITGSRGLGGDLAAADVSQILPLIYGLKGGTAERVMSQYRGDDSVVPERFTCKVSNQGPWQGQGADEIGPTILMQEDCSNARTGFRNFYWMSPDGRRMRQSRQWVSDDLQYLPMRAL